MNPGTSQPFYRPLSDGDVQKIDSNARRILKEVGIKVESRRFLDRLEAAGAEVERDRSMVRFSGEWLDGKLGSAPPGFTLYSRDGKNDLDLGSTTVHFANGGRAFRILNMLKGKYRRTRLKDIVNTATLVQNLDNIRVYVIACQAHDVPEGSYHVVDFFHAFNHTTKHVMGGCDSLEGAEDMWKLACLVAGGENSLREKPFVSVISNPISPLTLDENTLSILDFFCGRGIPVTCATAPIAGATAPMTLAGTLSQMHAEALAGVAVTQAFSPGAKVLYGAFPTAMDMKTMEVAMGCVEMGMMNASAVQLARLYNIPIYASGGVTEAKRPDIQAGFEKNFSSLTVAMMGADFIHLTAGLMDSAKSISYEQFVIDDENIAMIQRILAGIDVSEDTLAFNVISDVGPRGDYLMQEHTVRHMREEFFFPRLSERCSFDVWLRNKRPDMLKRAKTLVGEILENNREGILDPAVAEKVRKAYPHVKRIQPGRVKRHAQGEGGAGTAVS
ncbi:MAG: trimethylamine methyltransferase family protein [Kiritimatiellia bacterium]